MARAYMVHAELHGIDGDAVYEPLETDSTGLPPLYAEHFCLTTADEADMKIYKREGMTGDRGMLAGCAWVYREVEDVASMMEEVGHPYVDYSDYAKAVAGLLEE